MTVLFTPVLRSSAARSAVAAACLSTLAAASPGASYVPHVQLTPYQVVNSQNLCLQTNANGGALQAAACDSANNQQKFYVLNETADSEVIFQTQVPVTGGLRVRLVLASTFDTVPTTVGQYNLIASSGSSIVVDTQTTPNADLAHKWQLTRALGYPIFINYLWAANENSQFRVAGVRNIAYGANGQYIQKNINGLSYPDNKISCTNAFFGGDPAYGVPKACYITEPIVALTKFQVRIANLANPTMCIGSSSNAVFSAPCTQQDPTPQTFTFKPTSYPGP